MKIRAREGVVFRKNGIILRLLQINGGEFMQFAYNPKTKETSSNRYYSTVLALESIIEDVDEVLVVPDDVKWRVEAYGPLVVEESVPKVESIPEKPAIRVIN